MAVGANESSFQSITVTDATVKSYPYDIDNPSWLGAIIRVRVNGSPLLDGEVVINPDTIVIADSVTLNVDDVITIRRETPITQDETFVRVSYLGEREVERAIDKLTYIVQEIRDLRDGN